MVGHSNISLGITPLKKESEFGSLDAKRSMLKPLIVRVMLGSFIQMIASLLICLPRYWKHHNGSNMLCMLLTGWWPWNLPRNSQMGSKLKVAFRQLIFRWGGCWKCPGFVYCDLVVIYLAQARFWTAQRIYLFPNIKA